MKSGFPRSPELSLDAVSELSQVARELRQSMLESRRGELLAIFDGYACPGPISKPKFNALLLGFQEAWRRGDYSRIIEVGNKLPQDFLLRWREIQAYYGMALSRARRDKAQFT